MSPLLNLLFQATGNKVAQQLLQKMVDKAQCLMGIGSGTDAELSGEKGVFELLLRQTQSPCCIFDVGANAGQYLHLILKYFGNDKINIHCFEPGKSTFAELTNNAPKSSMVKLNNVALSNICGEAQLYYDEKRSGLASMTKRRLDHFNINFEQYETIKIETVDSYCLNNNINRINLLKIDVEGHELDVLNGANEMFKQKAIDIITFEFGGCNIDTRSFFQDFYYFFRNVEMRISRITPSGYLYPLDSYLEMFEQFRTTNFVATRIH
jgi:FkbM family methyltransferase